MSNEERFVEYMSLSYSPEYQKTENYFYIHFYVPYSELADLLNIFNDTHVNFNGWTDHVKADLFVAWDIYEVPEKYRCKMAYAR